MALIFEPAVSASQFLSAKRRRTSSRQNHRARASGRLVGGERETCRGNRVWEMRNGDAPELKLLYVLRIPSNMDIKRPFLFLG